MSVDVDTVVIGGMGGSGTRVVAEIMRNAGLGMGHDLNESLDDLTFTWLLKRPRRLMRRKPGHPSKRVGELVGLHESINRGSLSNTWGRKRTMAQIARVLQASYDHTFREGYYLPWWPLARAVWLVGRRGGAAHSNLWCFKEPHATIFLPELAEWYGERMAYLHVVRDGLDMALSRNTQQLMRWGWKYGLDCSYPTPGGMFEFWYRFNVQGLRWMEEVCSGPAVAASYDGLMEDPEGVTREIIRLLGIEGQVAGGVKDLVSGVSPQFQRRGESLKWGEEWEVRRKCSDVLSLIRDVPNAGFGDT